MAPKAKKGAAAAAAPPPPAADAAWECPECAQENEAADEACCACDAPRPPPAGGGGDGDDEDDKYRGYKVGVVMECVDVPNKDKLRALLVDVGAGEALKIVTNAPNVAVGARVVVATVGAKARCVACVRMRLLTRLCASGRTPAGWGCTLRACLHACWAQICGVRCR
jgi:tRNA-binding EMAP/Myf-like protein